MLFVLLLLVRPPSFKAGLSAHAQSRHAAAVVNGTVVLPCSFQMLPDKDIPTVEWSKAVGGPKDPIVFLYRDGCEIPGMKDPDFEYRTSLMLRELHHGKCSLRISNVKLSDAGTYECLIIQKKGSNEKKSVELVVDSLPEPKLSVVSADSGGVTVECKALCWKPAALITITDGEGNKLTDEEPKPEPNPGGCYNTKQNVTLQNPVSRVVCRVEQRSRNQSKRVEILLPDFWNHSYNKTVGISVGGTAVVCITAFSLYLLRKRKCSRAGRERTAQSPTPDKTMNGDDKVILIQDRVAENKQHSRTEDWTQSIIV